MQALLVVDVQNEFSERGMRPVPTHAQTLARVRWHVARARAARQPIAWVQHHNPPADGPAFQPGTWGAELSAGLGPEPGHGEEQLFQKDVFGAFTRTGLEEWLRAQDVTSVLVTGFYAHMCVSTTAREALVRGFAVVLDPDAAGACDVTDAQLGRMSADEVRRSAMLHLAHMGATIERFESVEFRENGVTAALHAG